ncbi:nitric oxide synthase-interacting [Dipodascopsis uninucleata]
MARHSKRNTASPFFTAYERSLLSQYGRQKQRLSSDSFRKFDGCNLCLMTARDPVACLEKGHIFCRQCIVENLIAQRSEIKRIEKEIQRKEKEEEEQELLKEEAEREKEVSEFEKLQSGLGRSESNKLKRKYEDDDDRSEIKNRNSVVEENSGITKSGGSSFWTPVTAAVKNRKFSAPKEVKLEPICPASDPESSHKISLKNLLDVHFEMESKGSEKCIRICPCCRKDFASSTDGYLTVPCGHVICKSCYDKAMKPHSPAEKLRCYVCDEDLSSQQGKKSNKRGILFLQREGTGFSGGGKSLVEREGIAFQA